MAVDSGSTMEEFAKQFVDRVGTIDPNDQVPMTLVAVLFSDSVDEEIRALFGMKSHHPPSVLVEWVPAGMNVVDAVNSGLTDEESLDPDSIPPRECWLRFPHVYQGYPVRYRRMPRLTRFD